MLREKREMKWWKTNGEGRHAPRSVGTPLHNLYNVCVFTLEKHSLLDHRDTTNATTAEEINTRWIPHMHSTSLAPSR